jgi:hypothetical protein
LGAKVMFAALLSFSTLVTTLGARRVKDDPLVMTNIAMENHQFNKYIIYKWAIFHSYVQ